MHIQLIDADRQGEARLNAVFAERASRALDRMAPNIRRVLARFRDVNGPKGGMDRTLTVEVALRDGRILRARAVAAEIMAAIDAALAKLVRRLADEHKRRLRHRRLSERLSFA